MENSKIVPKVFSPRQKFLWGICSLGGSLVQGTYGALLTYFYQTYLGLAANFIGMSALIYAIWNAVNDPLFGFVSDSTKSKRGRRIPYMLFTAPFLGLTFILIWLVPTALPEWDMFWWMLITMLLYDTTYTIIYLAYSALLPELTESDAERGELQKYASVLQLVGTILGFLLPDMVRPKEGAISLTPLYVGVTVIGIVGAISVIITSMNVKERPEFTQVDKPLGLLQMLKHTFVNKSFWILTCANFMSILMQSIVTGGMFYMADYVLQLPTIVPLVMVFLGLMVGALLANKIAIKRGVVTANQILLVMSGCALVCVSFLPSIGILICLLFAGFGLSGPLVLTNILFAQVADEDETRTGARREAAFFGSNAFVTKPAQSVAIALGAWMIESAGFIPADPVTHQIFLPQPDPVLLAIRIFVGLITGLAMLGGAFILHFYPLRGEYLAKIQARVLEMHAEKARKFSEQQ
ncbi:MAG: MFS transporter, partial [Candidatus Lokiarchaeota archaeon]|nr:MFS transporter [Candidatus Lokiarchaeota archaeon]